MFRTLLAATAMTAALAPTATAQRPPTAGEGGYRIDGQPIITYSRDSARATAVLRLYFRFNSRLPVRDGRPTAAFSVDGYGAGTAGARSNRDLRRLRGIRSGHCYVQAIRAAAPAAPASVSPPRSGRQVTLVARIEIPSVQPLTAQAFARLERRRTTRDAEARYGRRLGCRMATTG